MAACNNFSLRPTPAPTHAVAFRSVDISHVFPFPFSESSLSLSLRSYPYVSLGLHSELFCAVTVGPSYSCAVAPIVCLRSGSGGRVYTNAGAAAGGGRGTLAQPTPG